MERLGSTAKKILKWKKNRSDDEDKPKDTIYFLVLPSVMQRYEFKLICWTLRYCRIIGCLSREEHKYEGGICVFKPKGEND